MAADIKIANINNAMPSNLIPWSRNHDHSSNKRRVAIELLHRRLGHRKCRALLAASEHSVWENTVVRMGPEQECVSCNVSTIRAAARNKEPHTKGLHPGEYVFMDIIHPVTRVGITARAVDPRAGRVGLQKSKQSGVAAASPKIMRLLRTALL